jgi:membrane protease YdiL (CAAX protease family)
VRARDLFFGPEKLRALWRVLLFLVLAVAAFWVLQGLASLVLPDGISEFWQVAASSALLIAATLVASLAMMRWVERRPFAALGLPLGREAARDLLVGAAMGSGFIALLVVLQTVVGWLRPAPDTGTLVGWFESVVGLALLLAIAAAAEEFLFRGYPFQVLVEGAGVTLAVIISSALFAGVHVFNPEVGSVALLNIALAGVLMAAVYLRTRSLWVVIALHWGWNWVMAAVFDLPVSGIGFDVPGYDTRQLGPDLLTGGDFGPEGGLLTTLFAVPLIVWVFRTRWLKESPRIAALAPLVDSRLGTQYAVTDIHDARS